MDFRAHVYEPGRLDALHQYGLLDTPPEEAFDRITRLAIRLFGTPVALISLVDAGRQWFKACEGLDAQENLGDDSFCSHAIGGDEVLVVPDARADARFEHHPLVNGDPYVRFYAGAPLVTPEGYRLGTLCLLSPDLHPFSGDDAAQLHDLATLVVDQMELRRTRQAYHHLFDTASDAVLLSAADGLTYANEAGLEALGAEAQDDVLGRPLLDFVAPPSRRQARLLLGQLERGEHVAWTELHLRAHDGAERVAMVSAVPTLYNGQPAGQIMLRDLTEQKEREKQLAFQAEVLAQGNDAVVVMDRRVRITYVNPVAERLFGFRAEDVVGRDAQEVLNYHSPSLEGPRSLVRRLIRDGSWRGESLVQRPDGAQTRVESLFKLMRDGEGRPIGTIASVRDVTERFEAEAQARDAHQRLQRLAANVPGMIYQFRMHPDGTFSFPYVSSGSRRLCGVEPEAIQASPRALFDLVHADDGDTLFDSILASASTLEAWSWEGRFLVDGEVRWAQGAARPTAQADGGVFWDGLLADVTQQKRAEKDARAARARFEKLADNTPGLLFQFLVRPDGSYSLPYLSAGMRLPGLDLEALREDAMPILKLVHPDDARSLFSSMRKASRAFSPWHWEGRYHFHGRVRWLQGASRPTVQEDGGILWEGLLMDVTRIKRAEAALRESEARLERLALVARHTINGVLITDREGRVEWINDGFTRMTGYTASDLEGECFLDLFPFLEADVRRLRHCLSHPEGGAVSFTTEHRFQHQSGATPWLRLEVQPLLNGNEHLTGFMLMGTDVTAHKDYEQRLIEAKEHAEEMNRLKDSFLANMSHEIRTPLTGIIGFAEMLASGADGETREFAEIITRGGERLMETLNSVLDLAQLESRTLRVNFTPVDLVAHTRETVDLFRARAEEHGLSLTFIAPATPVCALLDSTALDRVLSNLVSNAIKFTDEGGVTVVIEADGIHATVHVRDTGIGISDAFMPQLFSEFTQESTGLARSHEGSGLGLTITRRLVDLMNGILEVESTKGKGSSFTVRFPLEAAIERAA